MLIGMLGLLVFTIVLNGFFYEVRVIKGIFQEPKYISPAYSKYHLIKRYK